MEKFYVSDSNRNKRKMILSHLVGIASVVGVFFVGTAAAAEYVSLTISPHNVGVFYQNKTQQFTATGITDTGESVNITTEVDWYIDPAGYPHLDQDTSNGAVATIDENGLATVTDTWGRVVVYACYPKGCAPNQTVLSPLFKLLLQSSITFSVITDTCVDGNGILSADKLTYTTEDIVANCAVAFQFILIPTPTTYTLTVAATATGSGVGGVLSSPFGIACATETIADCSETYSDQTPDVTLTANPVTGSSTGWTGCLQSSHYHHHGF